MPYLYPPQQKFYRKFTVFPLILVMYPCGDGKHTKKRRILLQANKKNLMFTLKFITSCIDWEKIATIEQNLTLLQCSMYLFHLLILRNALFNCCCTTRQSVTQHYRCDVAETFKKLKKQPILYYCCNFFQSLEKVMSIFIEYQIFLLV